MASSLLILPFSFSLLIIEGIGAQEPSTLSVSIHVMMPRPVSDAMGWPSWPASLVGDISQLSVLPLAKGRVCI
jgi:hypothetical protein